MHAYVVEHIVDGGHERRFQRAMRSKQNQCYSMKQSHQHDNLLLNCDLLRTAQVVSAVNGPALLLQLNLVEAGKKAANPRALLQARRARPCCMGPRRRCARRWRPTASATPTSWPTALPPTGPMGWASWASATGCPRPQLARTRFPTTAVAAPNVSATHHPYPVSHILIHLREWTLCLP